jgi:hypothetical protein
LFDGHIFSNLKNKVFIGGGILIDGLHRIDLNPTFELSYLLMHVDSGIKMSKIDKNSSKLWHKRLGHLSIERIKRLMNDEILNTFDFTNFNTCVDCIKGK